MKTIIKDLVLVGMGSFIGGVLRYLVGLLFKGTTLLFPCSTFWVNIVGCLFIGFLSALFLRIPTISPNVNLFLVVGFCGGFTTFSTFSRDLFLMLERGEYTLFLLYALGSILLGLLAVFLGFVSGKLF